MESDGPQWERLAYYVNAHRALRGKSQKAVTANGGPSDTTLSKIEAGTWRPKRGVDETLAKLDAGLDWEPGSASKILAGGNPVFRVSREDLGKIPNYDRHRETVTTVDTSRLARLLRAKAKPVEQRTAEEQDLVARSSEERRRAADAAQRSIAEESLIDLVDLGRDLADRKHDDEITSYVRRVESTVVLIMGMDDLAEGLEYRRERKTIARAIDAGILDQFMDQVDRYRVMGIVGRELQQRLESWLDAALTPNEAARSGVPGIRLSEANEHSVKTETVLPDAVYEAGFNTAGETTSPSDEGLFVATSGSSASAIPGLHVAWPTIEVVVDLPELPDRAPVTDGLAPRIDSDVLEGWSDATDDLHEKFSALQRVAKSGAESGADPDVAVRAFLTAIDIYVFATRELVRAMQAVDLYASEEQIRTGLVTFEYNIELATLYLPLVEAIEKSAPNKRLKVLPSRSAEGLRALISSLRAAHDAWIDAGLSSEHPAAAMRALAAAARTAPPGHRSAGQALRDVQDAAAEENQEQPKGVE